MIGIYSLCFVFVILLWMSRSDVVWARWRDLVEQQQSSGLSALAFCERMGLSQSSFFAWRRKLLGVPLPRSESTFAEVKVSSPRRADLPSRKFPEKRSLGSCFDTASSLPPRMSSPHEIELRLLDRWSIVVRPGFDQPTLAELLRILDAEVDP